MVVAAVEEHHKDKKQIGCGEDLEEMAARDEEER